MLFQIGSGHSRGAVVDFADGPAFLKIWCG